ncbi:MAG TPA: NADH-quinone oxidoreductase subunit H, partial [Orrella sp.]
MEWVNAIDQFGAGLLGPTPWLVVWTLIKIIVIAVPVILSVAYL